MNPHITSAERLTTGLVITFEDGRCAFYSAALLDSMYAQARDLSDHMRESDTLESVSLGD